MNQSPVQTLFRESHIVHLDLSIEEILQLFLAGLLLIEKHIFVRLLLRLLFYVVLAFLRLQAAPQEFIQLLRLNSDIFAEELLAVKLLGEPVAAAQATAQGICNVVNVLPIHRRVWHSNRAEHAIAVFNF